MIGFYGEGVSDPSLGFFLSFRGCPNQEEKLSSSRSGTEGVLHPTREHISRANFPCPHWLLRMQTIQCHAGAAL